MEQVNEEVCFADSDDDDYVNFDQQDLNTGIADLYDDDSASDAADDDDVLDINLNIDDLDINDDDDDDDDGNGIAQIHAISSIPSIPSIPVSAMQSNNKKNKKKDKKVKNKNKNKKKSSGVFSLFSVKQSAPKSRNKKKKKGKKANAFDDNDMISIKKQKVASKLNKRINRLKNLSYKQKQSASAMQNIDAVQKKKKIVHKQKVNTNIISIDLGTLSTAAQNISTGDAYSCQSCKSILSIHDKLLKEYDDIKLDDNDDENIWICAYCNYINIIEIDVNEIPKNETVDYMIAPPDNNTDNDNKTDDNTQEQIIFCIDISGSMCVTTQIDKKAGQKLKLKGNRLKDDQDALQQFIDPLNRNQWMPNQQNQNVEYVSRLQCVQSAVDQQIESISKTHPNYKIGLVTFNNDVTIIGDGMNNTSTIITGDKLKNINKLKEIGESDDSKINNNIKTAKDKLSKSLWQLKEHGQTALGPALVISIAIASSQPGSKVILCTDGLANIGVGSIDDNDNNNNDMIQNDDDDDNDDDDPILKWYSTLGDYALSKGVVVNIISITDDGCKLENLGKIVEITNGNLKRINPIQLTEKFSGIIENAIIATNCQTTMLLHPGLKFFNTIENVKVDVDIDDPQPIIQPIVNDNQPIANVNVNDVDNDNDNQDNDNKAADPLDMNILNKSRKIYPISRSLQDYGNVFEGESRVFYEYILNKKMISQFKLLASLPFQVQIEYSKKDGSKMMRVISQKKLVTFDKKKQRKKLNIDILAKYGTKVTTELCAKGDYESSRAWTSANTQFMNRNISYNNKKQLLTLANYANDNIVLDHKMKQQQLSEQLDDFAAPPPPSAASSSISFGKKGKKSKKSKMKKRKNARNDQFSNYMYAMKKSSHK